MTEYIQERQGLFVAVELPAGAKKSLAASIGQLRGLLPTGVRWVDPDGVHLNLKFLGEVGDELVETLLAALQREMAGLDKVPFPLHLDELEVFPNQQEPRAIRAGVGGDWETLEAVQRRAEDAVASLGFAWERRKFRPHLTLGRVRDGVAPAARRRIGLVVAEQRSALAPEYAWEVTEIGIIRSVLTRRGAVPLGMARLGMVKQEG